MKPLITPPSLQYTLSTKMIFFSKSINLKIDITFSTLRRIMKGHSPFVADAEHIHHKLLKAGLSQNKTVVTITFVAIVGGAIATALVGSIGHYLIYMLVLLLIMFGLSLISITRKKNINPEHILEEEQHKNDENK